MADDREIAFTLKLKPGEGNEQVIKSVKDQIEQAMASAASGTAAPRGGLTDTMFGVGGKEGFLRSMRDHIRDAMDEAGKEVEKGAERIKPIGDVIRDAIVGGIRPAADEVDRLKEAIGQLESESGKAGGVLGKQFGKFTGALGGLGAGLGMMYAGSQDQSSDPASLALMVGGGYLATRGAMGALSKGGAALRTARTVFSNRAAASLARSATAGRTGLMAGARAVAGGVGATGTAAAGGSAAAGAGAVAAIVAELYVVRDVFKQIGQYGFGAGAAMGSITDKIASWEVGLARRVGMAGGLTESDRRLAAQEASAARSKSQRTEADAILAFRAEQEAVERDNANAVGGVRAAHFWGAQDDRMSAADQWGAIRGETARERLARQYQDAMGQMKMAEGVLDNRSHVWNPDAAKSDQERIDAAARYNQYQEEALSIQQQLIKLAREEAEERKRDGEAETKRLEHQYELKKRDRERAEHDLGAKARHWGGMSEIDRANIVDMEMRRRRGEHLTGEQLGKLARYGGQEQQKALEQAGAGYFDLFGGQERQHLAQLRQAEQKAAIEYRDQRQLTVRIEAADRQMIEQAVRAAGEAWAAREARKASERPAEEAADMKAVERMQQDAARQRQANFRAS